MKNSVFYDLMQSTRNDVRKSHEFSIQYGGFLSKDQKERFKKNVCEMIDSLPEWNGNGYKFP